MGRSETRLGLVPHMQKGLESRGSAKWWEEERKSEDCNVPVPREILLGRWIIPDVPLLPLLLCVCGKQLLIGQHDD